MEVYESILGKQEANVFIQSLQKLQGYYEEQADKLRTLQQAIETKLSMLDKLQKQINPHDLIDLDQAARELPTLNLVAGDVNLLAATGTLNAPQSAPKTRKDRANTPKTAKKTSNRTSKPKEPKANAVENVSQPTAVNSNEPDLTSLRLRQYQKMTLIDAISSVLGRQAGEALHVDELLIQLYGKRLKKDQYDRVKHLVNNTLSRGKKLNRWQNVAGRPGHYAVAAESGQ